MEEESNLLVTRGSEAAEIIRLHTPEMTSYHENISFMPHKISTPDNKEVVLGYPRVLSKQKHLNHVGDAGGGRGVEHQPHPEHVAGAPPLCQDAVKLRGQGLM